MKHESNSEISIYDIKCCLALANSFPRLGENPFTMSALNSFLVDRITASDIDGSLVRSILKVSTFPFLGKHFTHGMK
jgi:hypothetical protein